MKRSEMLRIIWEAVNELDDADHILKRIEDAGMLPPCQCAIVQNPTCRSCEVKYQWEDEPVDEAAEKNWRERYGYDCD